MSGTSNKGFIVIGLMKRIIAIERFAKLARELARSDTLRCVVISDV